MALGDRLGLRAGPDPFEILEGDEFERDLKQRKGGLISRRKADRTQIENLKASIINGSLTDEQVQAKIQRNPGAATELMSAFQSPERQTITNRQEILPQFFQQAQPETLGPAPADDVGPRQVFPAQEARSDPQGAINALLSRGDLKGAAALSDVVSKFGGAKTLMKIPGRDQSGNDVTHLADPRTGDIVKTVRGKTRSISQSTISKLQSTSDNFDRVKLINTSFEDRFGGFSSNTVGKATTEFRKRFGDDTDFVQFWQSYQEQTNLIRKELFGTALTATEKAEFERARITPGMRPSQIRANLKRQEAAALRASRKLAKPFATGNFDSRQVREALGENADIILDGRRKPQEKKQNKVIPFSEMQ